MVVSEEQIGYRARGARQDHQSFKYHLCLWRKQPVENAHPKNEHARPDKEGVDHIPYRMQVFLYHYELLRRRIDYRRGYQQTGQHRKEHRAADKQLFVRLVYPFLPVNIALLFDLR